MMMMRGFLHLLQSYSNLSTRTLPARRLTSGLIFILTFMRFAAHQPGSIGLGEIW